MRNSVTSIFRKQGGISLIKNYAYNHVLLYAIFVFLIIPKNKKGLEILRECVKTRMYRRIKSKYRKVIQSFLIEKKDSLTQIENNNYNTRENLNKQKIIWFCWLQGIENAPQLVKVCYNNLLVHCSDYDIRVVTSENFIKYTDIPDYIIKKWKNGIITNAHFSDILRTSLLVENGGTWIDSTVLLTGRIPIDIEMAPLFLFRSYKPGNNGRQITLSSWFLSSEKNNPVLLLVQKLLNEYWKTHNKLCDYFLFHFFVQISLDCMPACSFFIPKYTNEIPHFMLFELGNTYTQEKWDSFVSQSFCHKLTNKLDESEKTREGTFYKKLLELSAWEE